MIVVVVTEDSLECKVAMGTGAEVPGVIQTHHLARTAGTGYARQVAGGSTLAALPLLIGEHFIINLSRLHNTLGGERGGGKQQKQNFVFCNLSCRGDKGTT